MELWQTDPAAYRLVLWRREIRSCESAISSANADYQKTIEKHERHMRWALDQIDKETDPDKRERHEYQVASLKRRILVEQNKLANKIAVIVERREYSQSQLNRLQGAAADRGTPS